MHDSSPDTDPRPDASPACDRLDQAWLDLPEPWRGGPRMYHHARGIRMIGRSGRPDVPGTLTYYRAMLAAEHRGEQDDDLARLYWRVCTTPSMVLPPERSAKERMRD